MARVFLCFFEHFPQAFNSLLLECRFTGAEGIEGVAILFKHPQNLVMRTSAIDVLDSSLKQVEGDLFEISRVRHQPTPGGIAPAGRFPGRRMRDCCRACCCWCAFCNMVALSMSLSASQPK